MPDGPRATKIEPVGAGKYSNIFKIRRGPRAVIMKMMFYRDPVLQDFIKLAKAGNVAAAMAVKRGDAVSVSDAFGVLSNRLRAAGVSPHFVRHLCGIDVKALAPQFGSLLAERLKTLTPAQKRYNHICFMEVFSTDLTKYLLRSRPTEAVVRGIVFQVLYTLAALQRLLPGFRHNDLSSNNILIKRLRKRASASYVIGAKTYYVANMPVLAAFSDYDFLHAPGHPHLSNERVTNGKYKVNANKNVSYDSHFFLKTVYKCVAKRHRAGSLRFPAAVEFFQRLRLKDADRQDQEISRLDPLKVLADPYFDPLLRRAPVSATYSLPAGPMPALTSAPPAP
jgi:hypothetical protein